MPENDSTDTESTGSSSTVWPHDVHEDDEENDEDEETTSDELLLRDLLRLDFTEFYFELFLVKTGDDCPHKKLTFTKYSTLLIFTDKKWFFKSQK